jgi:hypothetical protein
MRKLLLLSAIFLSQLVTSQVQAFDVEGRVAYLYPTEKRIRDAFGKNGTAEYQVEVGVPLDFLGDCFCDSPIAGFFNASYFQESHRARCRFASAIPEAMLATLPCISNKHKLEHWLITGGAKYYFECFECIRPYLGFGIGAGGARIRSHGRIENAPNVILIEPEHHERRSKDRWGFAILAKSGIEYDLTCNLFLDGFVDYGYTWFTKDKKKHDCGTTTCSSNRKNLDLGAVRAGLGLGYRF